MKTDREIINAGYLSTGKKDVNGKTIFEGSVIRADGYGSDFDNHMYYCVVFEDNMFSSIIYGDADSLDRYETIEVLGHALDYLDVYKSGDWSGNLGAAIKDTPVQMIEEPQEIDKLTAKELEAIIVDVNHVLNICTMTDEQREDRELAVLKLKHILKRKQNV